MKKLEVIVPEAGESITEGELTSWIKNDGEFVSEGELIAEVETDKATLEINASINGVLTTKASEGDTVNIGAVIAEIEEGAQGSTPPASSSSKEKKTEVVVAPVGSSRKKLEVIVPEAGESITEGELTSWIKNDGESVSEGELIAEVETDKATLEINALTNGILTTKASEGDIVNVGAVIAEIEEGAQGSTSSVTSSSKKEEKTEEVVVTPVGGSSGKKVEVIVPEAGESVTEGELTSWIKNNGESVSEGELIAEVETDKATLEINAPTNGALTTKANEGDTVNVGAVIAEIEEGAQGSTPLATSSPKVKKEIASSMKSFNVEPIDIDKSSYSYKHPSPSAARLIAEKELNPEEIVSTGKNGRIRKEDVEGFVPSASTSNTSSSVSTPSSVVSNNAQKHSIRNSVMNFIDQVDSSQSSLTIYNEINMTQLIDAYEIYEEDFTLENNVEMTYMGFFIKAIVIGLKKHPKLNANLVDNEVVLHEERSIALSFDTSAESSVMAVLKNVESMDFSEIEKIIEEYDKKAYEDGLTLNDISDATFSVISMGDRGSMLSNPSIYPNQSATLALHKIQDRAISVKGQIVSAPMMYVSLSYDRKVVSEVEAVDFLVRVKSLIENPAGMLIFK